MKITAHDLEVLRSAKLTLSLQHSSLRERIHSLEVQKKQVEKDMDKATSNLNAILDWWERDCDVEPQYLRLNGLSVKDGQ